MVMYQCMDLVQKFYWHIGLFGIDRRLYVIVVVGVVVIDVAL